MDRKYVALRAALASNDSRTARVEAGIAALRTTPGERVPGATELRDWLALEVDRITYVRRDRAKLRTKARLPLRDRLLARTRHQVVAYYSTCGYRVSESRWAGGEHSTDVVVVQTPTAGGARGDSSRAWSSNGKWSGTNSSHQITVDWSWLRTVCTRGIATVDGMLTLSARTCDGLRDDETAYTARWVQQGRGVSLQTRDGVIYRAGEEWMHAQTLQGARRVAAGRIAAVQAERGRAAKAVADVEAEIASLRGLTIHRSDIPAGVACASGVADWIAKRGMDAGTEEIDAADLLRLAVASGDRVNFARRIIAHAQQLSHHKAA